MVSGGNKNMKRINNMSFVSGSDLTASQWDNYFFAWITGKNKKFPKMGGMQVKVMPIKIDRLSEASEKL